MLSDLEKKGKKKVRSILAQVLRLFYMVIHTFGHKIPIIFRSAFFFFFSRRKKKGRETFRVVGSMDLKSTYSQVTLPEHDDTGIQQLWIRIFSGWVWFFGPSTIFFFTYPVDDSSVPLSL